jgi:arylsulfatase A-like enzyme
LADRRAIPITLAAALAAGGLAMLLFAKPPSPEAPVEADADTLPGEPDSTVIASVLRAIPPPPLTPPDGADDAAARAKPKVQRPHVVVVLGCTVRKDQISPYGAPEGLTPFLSRMAAEGTVFDDTVAAAPWTRPASFAILSGRHALEAGLVEPTGGRNDRVVPDEEVLLAERFRDAGYLTIGATGNPNLGERFGFHQGFDRYQADLPEDVQIKISGRRVVGTLLEAAAATRAEAPPDRRDAPLYLQVMLIDAHAPRRASPEDRAPWAEAGLPDDVADYRHFMHAFDDALAHLDARLPELGLTPDNTVLVVVGDHGEGLRYPDHHGFAHGQYLASSAVHVPWLLRGPGVAAGHRVRGVVSQVDVAPTVLALAGLPADPALLGHDLSPHAAGAAWKSPRDRAWSDTWFQRANRAAFFTEGRECQYDFAPARVKAHVREAFVDGCHDRRADPLFLHPTPDDAAMDDIRAWRDAHHNRKDAASAAVDETLAEQLRRLGYVE